MLSKSGPYGIKFLPIIVIDITNEYEMTDIIISFNEINKMKDYHPFSLFSTLSSPNKVQGEQII